MSQINNTNTAPALVRRTFWWKNEYTGKRISSGNLCEEEEGLWEEGRGILHQEASGGIGEKQAREQKPGGNEGPPKFTVQWVQS